MLTKCCQKIRCNFNIYRSIVIGSHVWRVFGTGLISEEGKWMYILIQIVLSYLFKIYLKCIYLKLYFILCLSYFVLFVNVVDFSIFYHNIFNAWFFNISVFINTLFVVGIFSISKYTIGKVCLILSKRHCLLTA